MTELHTRDEVIAKLEREVRGLRGCVTFDELSIREAIGNTNYSVAMLHFERIDEALALLRAPETPKRGWRFSNPDDELLPITHCVCGEKFAPWEMSISIYADDPTTMPCCGRRVYFTQRVEVIEVPPSAQTEDR